MRTAIPKILTPLPTLCMDPVDAWDWPQPPFARRHAMAALEGGVQPCRVETLTGVAVDGRLEHFDTGAGVLRFRMDSGGEPLTLAFTKFRRLTLTEPWELAKRSPDAPIERVPTAAQERGYRVELVGGGHLEGRTMGHVREASGLFLFAPLDDGAAVQRAFVPQAACAAVHFGQSAEEQAAERWIATPQQLFAALDAQKTVPIKLLGDALVDLGLITRAVLERKANEQGPERARSLGQMLVAAGLIEERDLRTALAHKMGYPLVDLARFPIDDQALRRLPLKVMIEHNVFPLIIDGPRLIVVIDDLARVPRLQALQALADMQVVPVLASGGRIAVALAALPQRMGDRWADNVPVHLKMLVTAPGSLKSA